VCDPINPVVNPIPRLIYSRHTIRATIIIIIIQFFIINVPSQQRQRQLQTQHSVDIGNKIKLQATE
jgi:hypothetical protein